MKKFGIFTLAAVMGLALMPAAASAAPITGSIGFGGTIAGPLTPTTTAVDITGAGVAAGPGPGGASTAGTYSALAVTVQAVSFNDFTFDPFPAGGYVPLWSFMQDGRTFSFDLQSVTIVSRLTDFLNLSGSGILHITGFDDTPGTWAFTASHAVGGALFTFDSNTGVTPGEGEGAAPEPASLLLLGLGLTGVASRLARKRAQ